MLLISLFFSKKNKLEEVENLVDNVIFENVEDEYLFGVSLDGNKGCDGIFVFGSVVSQSQCGENLCDGVWRYDNKEDKDNEKKVDELKFSGSSLLKKKGIEVFLLGKNICEEKQ